MLDSDPTAQPAPTPAGWRQALPLALGISAVAVVIIGLVAWSLTRAAPPPAQLTIVAPPGVQPFNPLLSPDGRTIAFEGSTGSQSQTYIRSLNQLEAQPLSGTEGTFPESFSPDGQWLLITEFATAPQVLKRVPLAGGRPITVAEWPRGLTACGESRSTSPILLAKGSTGSSAALTLWRMAMGTRDPEQPPLWIATSDLPVSPGHPFYTRLNALLDADGFDAFVEEACRTLYAPVLGRPSLAPGRYFRLLLVGYFEGIDSERGIAWRAADSLAVRSFLRLGLEQAAPDHSTISRTRRLIDVETHRAVFTWVQQRLVAAGLLQGRTVAIDATTLEANAAMRRIVRRDTGEDYQAYLTRLAAASGIKTPTREVLARFDRKRKKRTSNKDWRSPSDPDAKVAKMKDGRTHVAHKAEHARSGERRAGGRDAAGCGPGRHDDDRRDGDRGR